MSGKHICVRKTRYARCNVTNFCTRKYLSAAYDFKRVRCIVAAPSPSPSPSPLHCCTIITRTTQHAAMPHTANNNNTPHRRSRPTSASQLAQNATKPNECWPLTKLSEEMAQCDARACNKSDNKKPMMAPSTTNIMNAPLFFSDN